jgi:prepilin-type N-terminal cleavage/methylation domain-containing protein
MNHRGLTLMELLLVMVLLGILAGLGFPKLAGWVHSAAVNTEQLRAAVALDAARGAAVRLGLPVVLLLEGDRWLVRAQDGADSITAWSTPGPGHSGVELTGLGAGVRFSPSGIATGASNRTLVLSKGAVSRTVVVSRLGRIR